MVGNKTLSQLRPLVCVLLALTVSGVAANVEAVGGAVLEAERSFG